MSFKYQDRESKEANQAQEQPTYAVIVSTAVGYAYGIPVSVSLVCLFVYTGFCVPFITTSIFSETANLLFQK